MAHVPFSPLRLSVPAFALVALLLSCAKHEQGGAHGQREQAVLAADRGSAQPGGELVFAFDGAAVLATARRVRGIRIDVHGFPTFHDAWIQRGDV